MADLVDVASEIIEANVAYTLSHTKRFENQSNHECEECCAVIPEQRRKLGGVPVVLVVKPNMKQSRNI